MPNELLLELNHFMGSVRSNPPEGKLYEFLQELSTEGKLFDYSEQDWIEAGRAYAMADDDIASWIETAASWLDDTTEEGQYDPEPAFWSEEKLQANPSECKCEETCTCGDDCPCDPCKQCKYCLCCCCCEDKPEDHDGDDDYDGDESGEEE